MGGSLQKAVPLLVLRTNNVENDKRCCLFFWQPSDNSYIMFNINCLAS
jgi:hypothetical protein